MHGVLHGVCIVPVFVMFTGVLFIVYCVLCADYCASGTVFLCPAFIGGTGG